MADHIAVYWDFENVHASLYELMNGAGSYKQGRYLRQTDIVDVEALMNFILPIGPVAVNRAYANWAWFSAYASDFMNYTIDLIQLFPRGAHAKNGADIRMCVDIIEDINAFPHVGKVVIVGGDSDYIAVCQKLRQKGKDVIGIGVREATNRFWIASCNEFKFYDNLVRVSRPATSDPIKQMEAAVASDISDAKKLLVNAVARISSMKAEQFARMSALKLTMLQLDPAFDEATYGYRTFADFVNACTDVVTVRQGQYEKHIFLLENAPPQDVIEPPTPLEYYKRILKQQQVKLVRPDLFIQLCEAVCLSAKDGPFTSWDDFMDRVKTCLPSEALTQVVDADFTRLKHLLFRNFVFHFNTEQNRISIAENLQSPGDLVVHVFRNIIKRLLGQPDLRWDSKLVSELLYGNDWHAAEVEEWYRDIRGNSVDQPAEPGH